MLSQELKTQHSEFSTPNSFLSLLSLCIVTLTCGISAQGGLIDAWVSGDLSVLDNGDAVGSWTSRSNRTALAPVGDEPLFKKTATPTGEPAVQFDFNRMTVANSPVAGRNAFSMAVVFKVDQPGIREESHWFGKSGIVDASQSGVTNDWGFAVRETSYICFGNGWPGRDGLPGQRASIFLHCGWQVSCGRLHLGRRQPDRVSGPASLQNPVWGFYRPSRKRGDVFWRHQHRRGDAPIRG